MLDVLEPRKIHSLKLLAARAYEAIAIRNISSLLELPEEILLFLMKNAFSDDTIAKLFKGIPVIFPKLLSLLVSHSPTPCEDILSRKDTPTFERLKSLFHPHLQCQLLLECICYKEDLRPQLRDLAKQKFPTLVIEIITSIESDDSGFEAFIPDLRGGADTETESIRIKEEGLEFVQLAVRGRPDPSLKRRGLTAWKVRSILPSRLNE
jgi:hypothetical protein